MLESIYFNYPDYILIKVLAGDNDKKLPALYDNEDIDNRQVKEKSLRRTTLTDLFLGKDGTPQKVSLSITKIYYFIDHLTQGDLTMLSDFENLTEELSIVIRTFVTLGY